MVEQDRADGGEAPQVVLVGRVVAMPGDYVEGRMREFGGPEYAAPLHDHLRRSILVLKSRYGCEEIARVGETVGADRTAIGQGKGPTVVLAQVATGRPTLQ